MQHRSPLAFVDVETTGLSPATDRIAEIGVVTVDGARVDRWTSRVRAPRRRVLDACVVDSPPEDAEDAPAFAEIASALAQRLSGHLFIAHNARFDHAFLRAEFERVGVVFEPQVVCSVMLSRRLYPHLGHHDLDSLAHAHGLCVEARHRALPDADLVWQLWESIHRRHPQDVVERVVEVLLSGPVLPAELDPALIERLPAAPGAYVLHGEDHAPLSVGAAGNLRLHIVNYFRLDQASAKALECAHRVTDITWRATRGLIGAKLHAASLNRVPGAGARRKTSTAAFTWHLLPDAVPSIAIVPLEDAPDDADSYGVFTSQRRARNALVRLAARHRLCHCLLGIGDGAQSACAACPVDRPAACVGRTSRRQELLRLFAALRPLRMPAWPHRGPVGIRERSDLHVVDRWRFLGTARCESEVHDLLEARAQDFDLRVSRLLDRTLARLPRSRIVDLHALAPRRDRPQPDACAND